MFDRWSCSSSEQPVLSDERKKLVLRYMTEELDEAVSSAATLEPAPPVTEAPPPEKLHSENGRVLRGRAERPAADASPGEVVLPVGGLTPGALPSSTLKRIACCSRRPEGFGLQQKGLIAALKALEELDALREHVRGGVRPPASAPGRGGSGLQRTGPPASSRVDWARCTLRGAQSAPGGAGADATVANSAAPGTAGALHAAKRAARPIDSAASWCPGSG